jgi:hypothetical protein
MYKFVNIHNEQHFHHNKGPKHGIPVVPLKFAARPHALLCLVACALAACNGTANDSGQTCIGVPILPVIYLSDVAYTGAELSFLELPDNVEAVRQQPSHNNFFIAKIVKARIASDLAANGYQVTTDPSLNHDIDMKVTLDYTPDDWPFAHRHVELNTTIARSDNVAFWHGATSEDNWLGPLGDHMGLSGERMLADAARQTVAQVNVAITRPNLPCASGE